MSSHVSHLPEEMPLSRVDGQGMNAAELAANPAFATTNGSWIVHDLNRDPSLPFAADGAYDVVLVCTGVQYLQEPERVFAECSRALVPDTGVLIVSFTNSFFYQVTGEAARRSRVTPSLFCVPTSNVWPPKAPPPPHALMSYRCCKVPSPRQ